MKRGELTTNPQPGSYRDILWLELEKRQKKNSRYSMRSFARDLNMSPSQLSDVLRQKQGLSFKKANELAPKLHLTKREKESFPYLVQIENGRSPSQKALAKIRWLEINKKPDYKLIKDDVFALISDWYHYAILELITIEGSKSNYAWVARELQIPRAKAEEAVLRLMRLNMIRVDENKRWIQNLSHSTTTDDIPSVAIQKFHLQISHLFQRAIIEQSVQERDVESFVMAVDKSKIPELKLRIRKVCDELMEFVNQMEKKDTVYAFSLQLFRLLSR